VFGFDSFCLGGDGLVFVLKIWLRAALFLDKFVNGDPRNDDANGTVFEHDIMGNQLRHGGDLKGLVDSLDYIQGLGIKVSLLCINMRDACYRIDI